jgi:hypothetical protein
LDTPAFLSHGFLHVEAQVLGEDVAADDELLIEAHADRVEAGRQALRVFLGGDDEGVVGPGLVELARGEDVVVGEEMLGDDAGLEVLQRAHEAAGAGERGERDDRSPGEIDGGAGDGTAHDAARDPGERRLEAVRRGAGLPQPDQRGPLQLLHRLAQRPQRQQAPISKPRGRVDDGDVGVAGEAAVLHAVVEDQEVGTGVAGALGEVGAVGSDPDRGGRAALGDEARLVADLADRQQVRGVEAQISARGAAVAPAEHGHAAARPGGPGGQVDDHRGLAAAADGEVADGHDARAFDAAARALKQPAQGDAGAKAERGERERRREQRAARALVPAALPEAAHFRIFS